MQTPAENVRTHRNAHRTEVIGKAFQEKTVVEIIRRAASMTATTEEEYIE